MDQVPEQVIDEKNDASHPPKKRRTWLIALSITLGIILFFAVIYAAVAFLLVTGLKKTGSYLNGAPITVDDQVIEKRVQTDVAWLLAGDYDRFDAKLALTDAERLYRGDMDTLQQSGACTLTQSEITKGQGGFDGGASINYAGIVECAGKAAYEIAVQYHGTALSKKDAANMNRFYLSEVVVKTEDQSIIKGYLARTGEKITLGVLEANSDNGNRQQMESHQYANFDEYLAATSDGELSGCTANKPFSYQIVFRWRNKADPSDIKLYTAAPIFRCK